MGMKLSLREWGFAELRAALTGLLGLSSRARDEATIAQWFAHAFGAPALVLDSGSSALQLALTALASVACPLRREVVLPALACPALTRVVQQCGLTPIYADIGADLNTPAESVATRLCPRTLAVVMVHAYGHAADTDGLALLCEQAGVALIDDAAQRIDPASGLGSRGQFGVFSFAQSKNVVCGIDGAGGVLLLHDARLREPLLRLHGELRPARGRRAAWLEFALSANAPHAAYYVGRWRARQVSKVRDAARIGAIDAAIALPQLASLELRRTARQGVLEVWRDALAAQRVEAPQLSPRLQATYLARLLVRVPADRRTECRTALAAQGVATRLPYQLPAGLDARACPRAAAAAVELLELPLSSRLDAAQAECVARLVAAHCGPTTSPFGANACNITGN